MRQLFSIARESSYITGCLILVAIAIQGCQEAEAKEPRYSLQGSLCTQFCSDRCLPCSFNVHVVSIGSPKVPRGVLGV